MAFGRICRFLLFGILLPFAGAQPPQKASGLADATLEELMNIEVTSASKKVQRLASTAASVFVITSEDIRRSGISVLPELLRLAPGVQVARLSSGSWAIGIRGFNDDYSNKLLVLIDGRSVYNTFYSGVYWDALNVTVDDVERIEVIRGPGAAMWGTNAVNGVINVITKSAKSTQGMLVTGGVGSDASSAAQVRYGGETSGAYYRIGAQNMALDPYQIVSSPSPSRGWVQRGADVRLDWDLSPKDSLQVSGSLYQSSLGMVVPSGTITAPTAAPADDRIDTNGGTAAAAWHHVSSESSSIDVRFSMEEMQRNDPQTTAHMGVFEYGFQQHVLAGSRNDIIWGFTARQDLFHSTPMVNLRLNPANTRHDEAAIFAEDEIAVVPGKLSLIAGAQVSDTPKIGYAIQPTGRLLWTPTASLSSWIALSRADRTPSLVDRGLDFLEPPFTAAPGIWGIAHVMGNPSARSETVLAYEAGQRFQAAKAISFDFSTYYNIYHHLSSMTTGAPVLSYASGTPYLAIPITFGNQRHGESYGAELASTWNVNARWRLTGGYSWLRVETRSYAGDVSVDQLRTSSATPHHQWDVRSSFDVTRKVQFDAAFYYTAAMLQTGIPQHLRADLRLGWRLTPKVELSAGVQDALEANHLEYESTRFNQISQVPRNFYGKAVWRF